MFVRERCNYRRLKELSPGIDQFKAAQVEAALEGLTRGSRSLCDCREDFRSLYNLVDCWSLWVRLENWRDEVAEFSCARNVDFQDLTPGIC
jgi:hypothetical protein